MREPNLAELETIRREGFRPGVVACLIADQKLLMAYHVEYGLWQVPQGGINAGESLKTALLRSVEEELGREMVEGIEGEIDIVGSDRMEFPDDKREGKILITEAGEQVTMKGKDYFFAAVKTKTIRVNMSKSIYGVCRWVGYDEARVITQTIYQKGKRRVTEAIVESLREGGFIS